MKADREDVDRLRAAIAPLDTDAVRADYRAGNFPRADRVKDLDKRYRWDLYWSCSERFACDLKDSHIDTALRSIVAPLGGAA